MKSPILFLIFNRPDTTEKVWKIISEVKPPKIYIAADGPRQGRDDDIAKCEETRQITTKIDWPCEVKHLFRTENLGCGKGVSSAISWFFENEPQGIILEDDIEPDLDFFEYCDIMLDRYKDDGSIQLITGHNAFYEGIDSNVSYYKSSLFHMWGWASWRRVWQTYEFDTAKINQSVFESNLSKRSLTKGCQKYWRNVFDMMKNHGSDTWDYQLFFNQIIYGRYSLIPYRNITKNIGFTEEATHTTKENINEINHTVSSPLPIIHPKQDKYDPYADDVFSKNYGFYRFSLFERIQKMFKKLI